MSSSSANILVILKSINKYLYQIGGPILMLIGTIGCVLNLIVFTQKNLRKNPCSMCFIAYNIANFWYIYSSLIPIILTTGYNIDYSVTNINICRLRLYVTILSNCLSAFYLILASIDRIFVTSRNAVIRRRSTLRLAYISIIIGTLFWSLFHIHAIFTSAILPSGPNSFYCYYQQGLALDFVSYYALIKEILAFSLMIICGLWSIKNVRSTTHRVRAAFDESISKTMLTNGSNSTSSKDRQMILMLLMDITIYTIFNFLFVIYLMYGQITQYYIKNIERIQIENSIRGLCLFGVGISFSVSCIANLIVSKAFRNEVKKVFTCQ